MFPYTVSHFIKTVDNTQNNFLYNSYQTLSDITLDQLINPLNTNKTTSNIKYFYRHTNTK